MFEAPIVVLDSAECEKMIAEASSKRSQTVRAPENVALPVQHFSSHFVKSTSSHARPVAVFCVLGTHDGPVFYAIDAVCYHGKADLTQGGVVRGICDVEDLGQTSTPLCVECPGHGYLFSLATGSNIIRGAQFVGGKLVVGGLKAVTHMQRTYECVFDPVTGLTVFNKNRKNERFASD